MTLRLGFYLAEYLAALALGFLVSILEMVSGTCKNLRDRNVIVF